MDARDHRSSELSEPDRDDPTSPRPGVADLAGAAETLRRHFVEGRLTIDDYDRWMHALHGARTLPELQELVRSIPPALPPPPSPHPSVGPAGPGTSEVVGARAINPLAYVGLLFAGLVLLGLVLSAVGEPTPRAVEETRPTVSEPSSTLGRAASETPLSLAPPAVTDGVDPGEVPTVGYGLPSGDAPAPLIVDAESDGTRPVQASEAAAARYLEYATAGDVVGVRQHLCRPLREHFDDEGLAARLEEERAGRTVSYSMPGDAAAPASATVHVGSETVPVELRLVAEDGAWRVCGVGAPDAGHGSLLVPG